jgi:type II secretory pathway component GspD/PulD (secretin)
MRIALRGVAVVAGLLAAAALAPAAQAQTTVRAVISGSTVYVTVNSEYAESRSEYGAPILGKVPYVDRAFRNTSYGRHIATSRVTASVRIIDLREEEFRQTGFRSP